MSVRHVRVVIPVHDEEELVLSTLRSVVRSAEVLLAERPGLDVGVVVVLDACTDQTPQRVAELESHPRVGLEVLVVAHRNVGATRAAGLDHVASALVGADPGQVWVVCTDADTVVPESWLVGHVDAAAVADLVLGSVAPDPRGIHAHEVVEWTARYAGKAFHVHGANLGFRLAAYLRVDGFEPRAVHEDVRLVQRLMDSGCAWTKATTVVTSSRHDGRTPHGFAGYLRALRTDLRRPAVPPGPPEGASASA